MTMLRHLLILSGAVVAALCAAAPANALTMSECSAKYSDAKEAGTLGGKSWNQFRAAECGDDALPGTESAAQAKGLSMQECSAKYNAAKEAGTLGGKSWNQFRSSDCSAEAQQSGNTKNTSTAAAAPKGLTMQECSAKYNAAKEAGTLGGKSWNQFRASDCSAEAQQSGNTTTTSAAPKGLTMQQCSERYGTAKEAGALGGMSWNQFRKAQCGPNAAEDETVPYLGQATYSGDPEEPAIAAPRGVTFPRVIARKYSSETPGRARMHTCLEQYYANKDNDALNGLKWVQKGGGYYSLCNAKLKANLAG